ncbi:MULTISPECIES: transcriptional regulator [unclassified Streptomyces]|uniref:transcriptional regulator n=1 Tax=unclassified Streptomyces TaxID=2593676 RepID=UPI002E80C96E|nr:transcriptional regulator [Streptomyces sp. NBC_00589]WTI42085.1 transcriptional regulator [Streptomyces sp. NBC_00775]WUB24233.1 transcriptional regulator [Streptomyces sp. NBC_00589]
MTTPRFDELIHPSTRLSIVSLLAAADWADFGYLRDQLALSDSALSKQLSTLEQAGYVTVDRSIRRRVRARLTTDGRAAFQGHVAALQAIVATANAPSTGPAGDRPHN